MYRLDVLLNQPDYPQTHLEISEEALTDRWDDLKNQQTVLTLVASKSASDGFQIIRYGSRTGFYRQPLNGEIFTNDDDKHHKCAISLDDWTEQNCDLFVPEMVLIPQIPEEALQEKIQGLWLYGLRSCCNNEADEYWAEKINRAKLKWQLDSGRAFIQTK